MRYTAATSAAAFPVLLLESNTCTVINHATSPGSYNNLLLLSGMNREQPRSAQQAKAKLDENLDASQS